MWSSIHQPSWTRAVPASVGKGFCSSPEICEPEVLPRSSPRVGKRSCSPVRGIVVAVVLRGVDSSPELEVDRACEVVPAARQSLTAGVRGVGVGGARCGLSTPFDGKCCGIHSQCVDLCSLGSAEKQLLQGVGVGVALAQAERNWVGPQAQDKTLGSPCG